jgi:outer membrane immunogenic protein
MFRTISTTAIFAAATMMTASAAMADTGDRATHFNGFYIGAGGGYDVQSADRGSDVVFDTNRDGSYGDTVRTGGGADAFAPLAGNPAFCSGVPIDNSRTSTGCKGDKDRGEYFGRVGYDRRMGNFVVGLVVEGGSSGVTDRTTAYSITPHNYVFSRGIDWTAAARLRAGYTPNGGALFYLTGGGVYANLDHEFSTTNPAGGAVSFAQNGKDNAWGYQAGGGIELMVMKNISVGMEYLYTDINDDDYSVTLTGGPFSLVSPGGTNLRPRDQSLNYHAVRGTVAFRF